MSYKTVVQAAGPVGAHGDPALVFGHGAKLRADSPFLSLSAESESRLAGATRLAIVGYSFRDDHVNDVIRRWIVEHYLARLWSSTPSSHTSQRVRLSRVSATS